MLQNTPYGFLATSQHFTLGPGNLLNEGIRSYIQVSYDFIQDSNGKPVLTGPPSLFSLFLLPHLMDTLRIWYIWKGIFNLHLVVVVSWRTDHFPRNTLAFTGTRPLTNIINILAFHLILSLFGPLPLSRFKYYSNYSSILGVLGRVLGRNLCFISRISRI